MGRLFWKFFLSILLAQVAATIGIGGAFWLRDQARQRPAAILDSGPPAAIALDAASATLRHGGLPALREMLGEVRRPQIWVLDAARRDLLGRSVRPELLAQAERILADADGGDEGAARRLTGPDGARYVAFVSRTYGRPEGARGRRQGGPGPGPGLMPGMDPGFGRRIGQIAGIVAAVLASLLFAALLAWYFSRPIRALRSAFEAAAAGDLAPRFGPAPKGGDELSDLGRDFDRMSGQLRALMDGQRRLLHDVSHELRSPLARLQAAVGLAHQQPDKVANSLERIERESIRMDKLVGELLTLSRLEASSGVVRREPLDLTELVDAIVADARFEVAQASGGAQPRIVVDAAAPLPVEGDPDLLWSAIENVVRNAVKHGAHGGLVEVVLRAEGATALVEVRDRGPGIAPDDLPAVFEPFFRAGASRSGVDGHGLGLAIARRVVQAHGGEIVAANRQDGGLRVTMTLPR
ncbi:ATP-binding protein [Massilia sp. YIM B02443]|uniref:sensor histidine kinase n=1 Tax=Massilia sp. YIM B02443 TaxID=3050127 RepID=UPI0025B6DBD4|nr:ATP-binding protein [Massilia sp. YIM B02443]MDN4039894.1 ATP-binding protein [Massilia sp. YIM B02443]